MSHTPNRKPDRENLVATHKADQENARIREERAASTDGMTASERAMAESDQDRENKRNEVERDAFAWARSNQGFEGDFAAWLALDIAARMEYESRYWATHGLPPQD